MNTGEAFFLKGVGCLSHLLDVLGLYTLLRFFQQQQLIILMYHGITRKDDPTTTVANFDGKHLQVERFEEQLLYLKKHYTLVSWQDVLLWKQSSLKKLPRNPVLLTFDDGYKNCYTTLFPLLKKHHVPAMIFLPTMYIDKKKPAWYDVVTYCLATTTEKSITVGDIVYPLENEKQKIAAAVALRNVVREALHTSPATYTTLLDEIAAALEVDVSQCSNEDFLFVSWQDCLEMQHAGVTFGSHSKTHLDLRYLSEKNVEDELVSSKKLIESKLGKPCDTLSYPFGETNATVKTLVNISGYNAGFTTCYGKNTKKTDSLLLRRITVNNFYNLAIFKLLLFFNFSTFHHWLLVQYNQCIDLFKKHP